ncbi:MAG: ADP-forming succinate--CoA ligase subunit beta [Dehalococcoidia bacterium]|nr:ADP-forming succinate--CoA ligase subunit beta [Dehalococcoidia bacterium]
MKVHEYQAKALFAQFGIPVPKGRVAATPAAARAIAQELGGRAVVKAQVYAGGRGKAGGVKLVASPQEAEQVAERLLGKPLVTHQTGPQGVIVRQVLVEEASAIQKELYLGIAIDRASQRPVMMASEAGGMDIEEVAAKTPEKILRQPLDPVAGFQPYVWRRLAYGMNVPANLARPAGAIMESLYKLFLAKDCSLAEINPLVITADGRVLALDAKLNFDDNALYRQADIAELRDDSEEDPLEVEATKAGITYIKLDGTVGCMVNGAGLAMATMDMVLLSGARPANFLDVGGGASHQQVQQAFKIILKDPSVDRVLINVFGGILRCDIVATGIIEAAKELGGLRVPLVVRMQGTNRDEGKALLAASGLKITLADDLKTAAQAVVAAKK